MKLETFAMERLQSTWENRVAWNLAESGVEPLRLEELADTDEDRASLLSQPLAYTQTNGTPDLRSAIAAMYAGAGPEHIQVTNGGSEANCIVLWHLVERGDEVVMMMPNYMQVGGIARALGAKVRPWGLCPDSQAGRRAEGGRWRVDIDALRTLVGPKTRAVLICNPNNPTGACLTAGELDDICRVASHVGAWVVSDEIYRGAELDGGETVSVWGRGGRVLVTSGLSKAYGLPGLRIGWVAGPPATVETLWGIHDYTTIAPGALNDRLARMALAPGRRERLLARTRSIVRGNYPIVRRWIEHRHPRLSHIAPQAGAIAFVRFAHNINSTRLIERLRDEKGVLIVPGDHFGMDGYLRIGFGSDPAHVSAGLDRAAELLDSLPAGATAPTIPSEGPDRVADGAC